MLMVQTAFLLVSAQLCVTFSSLPLLIKLFKLKKYQQYQQTPGDDPAPLEKKHMDQIYWAISTTRRILPFMKFTKCLAQALTARHLLKKRKIPCVLLIGAKIVGTKQLEAHAWLQCAETTMNFGADDIDFTELTRFY